MDNVVKELSSQAVTQGTWCVCRHSQQTNNRMETTSQKQASAHEHFLERDTCKLTFAVIFALCGLFVHGEPPSVLMFVLDLYSWLGPRVLARLYLWRPVLLHLRDHLLPARLLTAQSPGYINDASLNFR